MKYLGLGNFKGSCLFQLMILKVPCLRPINSVPFGDRIQRKGSITQYEIVKTYAQILTPLPFLRKSSVLITKLHHDDF